MKPITKHKSEIVFVTPYPPRECVIASYSLELTSALKSQFGRSFSIQVCALDLGLIHNHRKAEEVTSVLDTSNEQSFLQNAIIINNNPEIRLVLIQHEFDFFENQTEAFLNFLHIIKQPIVVVFHTVLPQPDALFKKNVQEIAKLCDALVVMTRDAKQILISDYSIAATKLTVNPSPQIGADVWENSAIAFAKLIANQLGGERKLLYTYPEIKVEHLEEITTHFGVVQFSNGAQPNLDAGYTLDDNASALVVMCMYYEMTRNISALLSLQIYLNFIQ